MDRDKLKGKLREKKKTYAECARAIGVTITTFSNKINGKSDFDIVEINELSNYLNLTETEAMDIFLNKNLHKMQERR